MGIFSIFASVSLYRAEPTEQHQLESSAFHGWFPGSEAKVFARIYLHLLRERASPSNCNPFVIWWSTSPPEPVLHQNHCFSMKFALATHLPGAEQMLTRKLDPLRGSRHQCVGQEARGARRRKERGRKLNAKGQTLPWGTRKLARCAESRF